MPTKEEIDAYLLGFSDGLRNEIRRDYISPPLQTAEALVRTGRAPKKRKRSQYDRALKRALKDVNAASRTKSGKLRKGVSQAMIMKRAHKLARKMMK